MTGTFLDVDAPDTAWRAGSEDPIPVVFGRWGKTAFVYRFITCRPLDGHARTNATFWRAGTKALTHTGKAMPYQYWPGWKRGLLLTRVPPFLVLPPTALAALNEVFVDKGPWWAQWEGAVLPWIPFAAYFGQRGVRYAIDYPHQRHIIEPITGAAVNILRSRGVKVEIPRSLVNSEHSTEEGRIWLPLDWSGAEGDRENLSNMLQERLGSPIYAEFDMAGRTPSARLTIPKQPPKVITWERMIEAYDIGSPYLGDSATGPVFWDLGEDSPHIGIVGGSGSGKSELMAWIVAQFMRGGAGVAVLDPKNTSHAWLIRTPGVLYCSTSAMIHDTVMWLDGEMDRRAAANRESVARGGSDIDFPRLVVVLEERNSLQDKLRDRWAEIRQPGMSQMSPAIRALDRLSSMGRSLCITVLLAAQATAQQDIGKKNNYGSWAIAGRMAANHYKNIGITPKPSIAARPGRFAYVVAGQPTVFQAAYPNLRKHSDRLAAWALGGDPLLNIQEMMTQQETAAFPSSSPVSSSATTQPFVTFSEYVMRHPGVTIIKLRNDRARYQGRGFPEPVTTTGTTHRYREEDLTRWLQGDEVLTAQ